MRKAITPLTMGAPGIMAVAIPVAAVMDLSMLSCGAFRTVGFGAQYFADNDIDIGNGRAPMVLPGRRRKRLDPLHVLYGNAPLGAEISLDAVMRSVGAIGGKRHRPAPSSRSCPSST